MIWWMEGVGMDGWTGVRCGVWGAVHIYISID